MRDRFESFAVSVLELGRQIQKIKELEMGRLGLKASHTCACTIWEIIPKD